METVEPRFEGGLSYTLCPVPYLKLTGEASAARRCYAECGFAGVVSGPLSGGTQLTFEPQDQLQKDTPIVLPPVAWIRFHNRPRMTRSVRSQVGALRAMPEEWLVYMLHSYRRC